MRPSTSRWSWTSAEYVCGPVVILMSDLFESQQSRAQQYAEAHGVVIEKNLGFGVQGAVYSTDRQTALKVHDREQFYQRERDVYFRLQDCKVSEVCGCAVPRLISYDDRLCVIEMTIVKPPYVLDFASAYLDQPPDYSAEVIADWKRDKEELFEESWPDVQFILFELERLGIFLRDVHPGNIRLAS